MAAISSIASPILLQSRRNTFKFSSSSSEQSISTFVASADSPHSSCSLWTSWRKSKMGPVCAVVQHTEVSTEVAARRLYVGNIPRTVTNEELSKVFGEHGSVEKAEVMYDKYSGRSRRFGFVTMSTVEDATAATEKLNDSEIEGRKIKVNVTEKPLLVADMSLLQAEDSKFVDSPYKVYVGNLAKTVTAEMLTDLFAEKGKVLSAKVSRLPGTSKSSGFGFVSFSSEENVDAAIASFNNKFLEGQKIRVNKA